jgi:hypothetical protein
LAPVTGAAQKRKPEKGKGKIMKKHLAHQKRKVMKK